MVGMLAFVNLARAFDDFALLTSEAMHEETSWQNNIYTLDASPKLWSTNCPWLQAPSVALRFNATHQERFAAFSETDLYQPMASLSFQTIGGINVGLSYAHGFLREEQFNPLSTGGPFKLEGDSDSVGGYVSKQWDCGLKIGGTWAYTTADLAPKGGNSFYDFDTVGASGALGFARSFGEKKFGRNVFVDTSANFLYESEDESWHFVWLAKAGHNLCQEFAIYGIFNLFQELEQRQSSVVPYQYSGYHPSLDTTWGEAGGGFQAQLGRGFSLTAEATTPIMDAENTRNAFQVRSALNWSF